MVVLESMSTWVPVVSYNSPWVREIISNKENSFIAESKDDFFKYTYNLLKENSLNKKISNHAKKITIKYNSKSFEDSLEKIF